MNIIKEQQIYALKDEVKFLFEQLSEKRRRTTAKATIMMIYMGFNSFLDYLDRFKFTLEEVPTNSNEKLKVLATLAPITVTITKSDTNLDVQMSNGENYYVSIDGSFSDVRIPDLNKLNSKQDTQLQSLKQSIEEIKDKLDHLDKEEFRYIVHTEEYVHGDIKYKKKSCLKFKEVLEIMFS